MNPLVSVVVPVYKVEDFLVRCVESLLVQTYPNIEILLIDDGSPDRCGQICDELAKKDSRIRVFHKRNGGLSDARNYGTQRAIGEFVAYIDSDDFVAENYIERMMCAMMAHNADVVCCNFIKTVDDNGYYCDADRDDLVFTGREACNALLGQYYIPLVVAWCKIYRYDIVLKNPFPVGKIHEDEATTCKLLYAARRVILCADKLYAYYQNPNSITQDGKTSNYSKKLWGLSARAEFFENVGDYKLANAAWSLCVRFLGNQAVLQKKSLFEIVVPFIKEHRLWKRLDLKTYLKMLIIWLMPGVLRRKIEDNR